MTSANVRTPTVRTDSEGKGKKTPYGREGKPRRVRTLRSVLAQNEPF